MAYAIELAVACRLNSEHPDNSAVYLPHDGYITSDLVFLEHIPMAVKDLGSTNPATGVVTRDIQAIEQAYNVWAVANGQDGISEL